MVRKLTPEGTPYHELPYTKEEIEEYYRRIRGGPISILHSGPRDAPARQETSDSPPTRSDSAHPPDDTPRVTRR